MIKKLLSPLLFIAIVFILPIEVFASNKPSIEILSPNGNEVYKKGEPALAKIKIDNIPRSGATLWLQEAIYQPDHKTYSYRFVISGSGHYFKRTKGVTATIPLGIDLTPINTDVKLVATLWEGHYEGDGKDKKLASDWNDGVYRVIDVRGALLPDFVIEKIEYNKTEGLKPGKVAKVKVSVRNVGAVNTQQKLEIVTYTHRQAYSDKIKSIKVVPPKVGEVATYTLTGKVNTQTGKDDQFLGLYVELDPNNKIAELSDRNTEYKRVR